MRAWKSPWVLRVRRARRRRDGRRKEVYGDGVTRRFRRRRDVVSFVSPVPSERSVGSRAAYNAGFVFRRSDMARLGFVGLGVMGSRVVKRLLAAGHTVTGYNRTRAKAQWLVDAGMTAAGSPRAVAEAADITFTMVTNTSALRSVMEGPAGLLAGISAGKIHVDMSTVSPSVSRALAQQVATKGGQMLDAPVSGSVVTLEEGKLTFMVGGERSVFETLKPIFLDVGARAIYVGGNGLAVSMKIATNLSLAVQMLAFSEGVLLAEKSGIARDVAVDVLVNSVIGSP